MYLTEDCAILQVWANINGRDDVIRLYRFGPAWGKFGCISQFVLKIETYLRMAGIEFETCSLGMDYVDAAPKGRLPYIEHNGVQVADSGFILDYLKAQFGDLLDAGLSPTDRAHGHTIKRIGRSIPKGGRLDVHFSSQKAPAKGAPVFLIDRREKALAYMISDLEKKMEKKSGLRIRESTFKLKLPAEKLKKGRVMEMPVHRKLAGSVPHNGIGIWLSLQSVKTISARMTAPVWWWLPPVVWPGNENELSSQVEMAVKKGSRHFVLNAPWQVAMFKKQKGFDLWAGPFCNLANPLALVALESLGFNGAVVSPELDRENYIVDKKLVYHKKRSL